MIGTKHARVILADDHSMVAAGLSKLVEADFDLVATVENGRDLVDAAQREQPDVILLDISMPLMNGLEAARQIRELSPRSKMIFLTVHSDTPYILEAFRAGASGYVLKRSAASELTTAVRQVLDGGIYVTPLIPRSVVENVLSAAEGLESPFLSTRQREVLQLVAEGHSAKEIGGILHISSKTVEFHKGLIMKKLNLHSTAELTRYALEHGISGSAQ